MKKLLTIFLLGLCQLAQANDQFTLQADFVDSELKNLRFDYRAQPQPTGFTANGGKLLPGSGCFAKLPGSDNLTAFIESIKDQPGAFAVADTRKRTQDAMDKIKKDIWQEILCVGLSPYPESVKSNPGKWSAARVFVDGERKGTWGYVYTVVRPNHIYSITVRPRRTTDDPAYQFGR